MRTDATTTVGYLRPSNLQSMDKNLRTSDVLDGFYPLPWVWRVVYRFNGQHFGPGLAVGTSVQLACVVLVLSDCSSRHHHHFIYVLHFGQGSRLDSETVKTVIPDLCYPGP